MSKIIKLLRETKKYGFVSELDHLRAYYYLKYYNDIPCRDGLRKIYFESLSYDKQCELIEMWYLFKTRKKMDIKAPKNYNEKLQWLKLNDRNPQKTLLADKYLVRQWIADMIGEEHLIPLLGVWDTFDEIDFSTLPDRYALKCNHGSGYNYIVNEKHPLDYNEAKEKFDKWINEDFEFKNGFELQYIGIPRKILAEQYIENSDSDLYDYKFFCFNGKVELILIINDRSNGIRMSFFDRNWNTIKITYGFPASEEHFERPDNLDEMIELSEKLAADFNHVRVDFYRLDDGTIYFGEMTFSSFNGLGDWQPEEFNTELGNKITCI